MKVTESMLRDYVETKLTAEQIGDLLTMTGFELEDIEVVSNEKVLDVNIMANRGDGASVIGLAREILAKDPESRPTELMTRARNRFPAPDQGMRDVWAKASAAIETTMCTRLAVRVFENVGKGETPQWIQDRLTQIGQRPISLLVDLTNYVMFETGQPLHAYDLDKLNGERIIVRQALDGEELKTLDGVERRLYPRNMVICDSRRAVGLAGVMGGEATEVGPTTTRCLLESAHFVNTSIRKTRKDVQLQTEATYRFERHVDPMGVVAALNRFAELLEQAGGPRPVGGVIEIVPAQGEATEPIHLRMSRADRILGVEIPAELAKEYLEKLGFSVTPVGPRSFDVIAPTWRIDVVREDDLVEEIGRVYGYELIPETALVGTTGVGGSHGVEATVDQIVAGLLKCGFDETVSHSLGDVHALDAGNEHVQVLQPHAPEMARLRNSLLPGLARAAVKNGSGGFARFESGRIFTQQEETRQIAALTHGVRKRHSWQETGGIKASYFTLKGVLETLLSSLDKEANFAPSRDLRLHPTRQASIRIGSVEVGRIGEIHPDVCIESGLPEETIALELDVVKLHATPTTKPAFRSLARNPAVRRDVSMVFPKATPYESLEAALKQEAIADLEEFWLFDLYAGQGVEPGHQSLSFGLSIRRAGSNLTDEQANQVRDQFVSVLTRLGGQAR